MMERTISLYDLGRLLQKHLKLLLFLSLASALIGFGYALFRPVEYVVEATFKEQGEIKADGPLQSFKEALNGFFDSSQTPLVMKSHQVLKPLIFRLGLQVHRIEKESLFQQLRSAFRAEMRKSLPEQDSFRFQNVSYEGEKRLKMQLRCIDANKVELSWKGGTIRGQVGEELKFGSSSLIVASLPRKVKMGRTYYFSLSPWNGILADFRKRCLVTTHKQNRAFYHIRFLYPDRFFGAEIVNELIAQYLHFLKREHDQRIELELSFLQKRQEELIKSFEKILNEQKSYLQTNVDSLGFMDLKQELGEISSSYRDFFVRFCALEMEEKRLLAWREQESPLLLESTSVGSHLQRLHALCEDLHRERDLIESSLHAQAPPLRREESLQQVRSDLLALSQINAKQPLSLFCDPDHMIADWAQTIAPGTGEARDFHHYMQNLSHQLSIRERFLQESSGEKKELDCVDLETARRLLVEGSVSLEGAKSAKEKLLHLIDRMENGSFELSSLNPFLQDEASQRLLSSALQLQFQLQDTDNYTEKEQERARRTLLLQRKILSSHIRRLLETEQLRELLAQEKVASLQRLTLDSIHRQISVHREQMLDLVRQRKESIKQEESLLERKMEELRGRMGNFPQKWYSERLLKLRSEINGKLVQIVNQLVETKTIGRHLHHIASRVLDDALVPRLPKKPHLLFYGFAGALMGFFPAYFILFALGILTGLPVGADTLKALNLHFAGWVGCSEKEDLETLKKSLLSLSKKKEIALIMGKGPDYYPLLSRLFPNYSFLLSRVALDSVEALSLIGEERGIIVTVCDEPLEQLTPYLSSSYCFLKAKPLKLIS